MSCGAPEGGVALGGVDVAKEAVVQGVVARAGTPVDGAYVRLLDTGGDFVAEVRTGAAGEFRFFAAPGTWTVRVLAPGTEPGTAPADRAVEAGRGRVAEVVVEI